GVHAVVAEDLAEDVGGPVDHGGLPAEPRGGGDVADDLDDPHDGVDPHQPVDGGERVESAHAREFGGLLRADLGADLAGRDQGSVAHGQLPGGVDEVTRADGRHVVGHGRDHGGQLESELLDLAAP